jgi:hypothetical protein
MSRIEKLLRDEIELNEQWAMRNSNMSMKFKVGDRVKVGVTRGCVVLDDNEFGVKVRCPYGSEFFYDRYTVYMDKDFYTDRDNRLGEILDNDDYEEV